MSRANPLPRSGDCSKAVMVGVIGGLRVICMAPALRLPSRTPSQGRLSPCLSRPHRPGVGTTNGIFASRHHRADYCPPCGGVQRGLSADARDPNMLLRAGNAPQTGSVGVLVLRLA